MAKAKQHIETHVVLKFLQENFNNSAEGVMPVGEGETSAAFFFAASNKQYVIRVGGNLEFFEKDRFAGNMFSSPYIPIPKIIALGVFEDDVYYAVSERIEGNLFFSFKGEEFNTLLPHFIETLDAIHATDIDNYSGYGDWNKDGKAYFQSWKASLEGIQNEDYFHWQDIFTNTFFTEDAFKKLHEKFQSLLPFCPEERQLVHGDFGVNNLLAKNGKITGVLDWGLSRYGDFLYDIAWIDFWPAQVPFGEVFFKHYKEKGIKVEHYRERIMCYKLYFVIASLHFEASRNNKEMFDYIMDRIWEQIKQADI